VRGLYIRTLGGENKVLSPWGCCNPTYSTLLLGFFFFLPPPSLFLSKRGKRERRGKKEKNRQKLGVGRVKQHMKYFISKYFICWIYNPLSILVCRYVKGGFMKKKQKRMRTHSIPYFLPDRLKYRILKFYHIKQKKLEA